MLLKKQSSEPSGTGVQKEDATGQLHALGKVEAREGEQSLAVCFYLTDNSQAGNLAGMQRCTTRTL